VSEPVENKARLAVEGSEKQRDSLGDPTRRLPQGAHRKSETMRMSDRLPKSERAATGPSVLASGGRVPACPICEKALSGRQRTACSDQCKSALSRQRKAKALQALHQEVHELLIAAVRILEEKRRGSKRTASSSPSPCSRHHSQPTPRSLAKSPSCAGPTPVPVCHRAQAASPGLGLGFPCGAEPCGIGDGWRAGRSVLRSGERSERSRAACGMA
jgi:predicted nucleic acid-binding Zn ribbon protein